MLDPTVPLEKRNRVDVGNVAVEVVEGPDAGKRVETEDETLTVGSAPGNFLALSDRTVSGYHLELSRRHNGIHVVDLGSTNGTRLGNALIGEGTISGPTQLRIGKTLLRVDNGSGAKVEVLEDDHLGGLFGKTEIMRRMMAKIVRVAPANAPVLILGESGTGKELVARAIHEQSPRAANPFVTVDCGSLLPSLIASELFGHERGAFTGAERQHQGAFERAEGGTLFLDELGELSSELQPQLLGALERRRFVRVGGKKEVPVDVRVVCATNRDLRSEVNAGTFRMDLYYRVAVVTLALPPLRERPDDIPTLVEHFLRESGHDGPVSELIPASSLDELRRYRWPGNVRELRNWVEATLAVGEAPELNDAADHGGDALFGSGRLLELTYKDARSQLLDDFEKAYCAHLLEQCAGNVSRAARQAHMDRSYLIKLLQRHGLK